MRANFVANHLQLANNLYTNLRSGGAAVNNEFQAPTGGYQVSVQDGPTFDNISTTNAHEVSAWIKDNENEVRQSGNYFGSWLDRETGRTYFDISANFENVEDALNVARENNQIAIWDIENNQEIRV